MRLSRVSTPVVDCGCHECTERAARQASVVTAPFDTPFPVPEYPPAEWFDGPPTWVEDWRAANGYGPSIEQGPQGPVHRLTITDDGQVGGWFATAGVCLVDGSASMQPGAHQCVMWEPSPTGYSRFMQSDVATSTGDIRPVGVIGVIPGGHASPHAPVSVASRAYADPRYQRLAVAAGDSTEPLVGGWIAGALVPGTTYGDVAQLRRSALSGDWRWFQADAIQASAGYDCLGPTVVTRPGLAIPRPVARVASAHPDLLSPESPYLPRQAAISESMYRLPVKEPS